MAHRYARGLEAAETMAKSGERRKIQTHNMPPVYHYPDDHEFWASHYRIALILFRRWTGCRGGGNRQADGDQEAPLKRLVYGVKNAMRRLNVAGGAKQSKTTTQKPPILRKLGHPGNNPNRGTLWTLKDTSLDAYVRGASLAHNNIGAPPVIPANLDAWPDFGSTLLEDNDAINPTDRIGSLFLKKAKGDSGQPLFEEFSESKVKASGAIEAYNHVNYVQGLASGDGLDVDAKIQLAAYRPERDPEKEQACMMPFFVLRQHPSLVRAQSASEKRHEQIDYLLDWIAKHKCSEEELFFSHDRDLGFHLYVPSGVFGSPLFRAHDPEQEVEEANAVIEELALGIGWAGYPDLLAPDEFVRVPGTKDPTTGLYKRLFTVREVGGASPSQLIKQGQTYEPVNVDDPHGATLNPKLAAQLLFAADKVRHEKSRGFFSTSRAQKKKRAQQKKKRENGS